MAGRFEWLHIHVSDELLEADAAHEPRRCTSVLLSFAFARACAYAYASPRLVDKGTAPTPRRKLPQFEFTEKMLIPPRVHTAVHASPRGALAGGESS